MSEAGRRKKEEGEEEEEERRKERKCTHGLLIRCDSLFASMTAASTCPTPQTCMIINNQILQSPVKPIIISQGSCCVL